MATFSRHAVLDWGGDVMHGSGTVAGGTAAFTIPASFPLVVGEPPGVTTPEELLAASHAVCFGIGLRSVIGRRGGKARRVTVQATITAEKGPHGIRIQSSHLHCVVDGLEGIEDARLQEIARATEEGCTISNAIRASVAITYEITAT
jgi:lipoyl-dependent peroxiredoxin